MQLEVFGCLASLSLASTRMCLFSCTNDRITLHWLQAKLPLLLSSGQLLQRQQPPNPPRAKHLVLLQVRPQVRLAVVLPTARGIDGELTSVGGGGTAEAERGPIGISCSRIEVRR